MDIIGVSAHIYFSILLILNNLCVVVRHARGWGDVVSLLNFERFPMYSQGPQSTDHAFLLSRRIPIARGLSTMAADSLTPWKTPQDPNPKCDNSDCNPSIWQTCARNSCCIAGEGYLNGICSHRVIASMGTATLLALPIDPL